MKPILYVNQDAKGPTSTLILKTWLEEGRPYLDMSEERREVVILSREDKAEMLLNCTFWQ